jgi:hypothetical protein
MGDAPALGSFKKRKRRNHFVAPGKSWVGLSGMKAKFWLQTVGLTQPTIYLNWPLFRPTAGLTPRMKLRLAGTVKRLNVEHRTSNIDKIVKSRFNDWIPAFAGMTSVVSV